MATTTKNEKRLDLSGRIGLDGATDEILSDFRLRRKAAAPCPHPKTSYGFRLDCVLAHMQDVHRWDRDRLANWLVKEHDL